MHPELEEHLLSRKISDDPNTFLFPSLAGKSGGGRSGLSMAFKRLMEKAGVEAGIARLKAGKKAARSLCAAFTRSDTASSRRWQIQGLVANCDAL